MRTFSPVVKVSLALSALACAILVAGCDPATTSKSDPADGKKKDDLPGNGPAIPFFLQGKAPATEGIPWSEESGNKRTAIGDINPDMFSDNSPLKEPGARIGLDLFDGLKLVAIVKRAKVHGPGRFDAFGTLEGFDGSSFIATCENGVVSALVSSPGKGSFRVEITAEGKYRLLEQNNFNPACPPAAEVPVLVPDPPLKKVAAATAMTPATVDIAIFYTAKAQTGAGGAMQINSLINTAVAEANAAYVNSEVNIELRLVYKGLIAYTESGIINTDLVRLQSTSDAFLPTVHGIRDAYGADVVTLITETGGNLYAGLGYVMAPPANSFKSYAFNVVRRAWATGYGVLPHEVGHNMGNLHNASNSVGGVGAYSYSFGWKWTGSDGVLYRDIMAYDPGTRTAHFSNPDVTYMGVATGTSTANNALSMNNVANTIAGFRNTDAPPSVTITSPTDGATFTAPNTVVVNATATDNGAIQRVKFFLGDSLVKTMTAAPFFYAFTKAAGSYTVTVRAYDLPGDSGSASTTVTLGATELDDGWSDIFYGATGITGKPTESGGVFTFETKAGGVAATADGIQFVYKGMSGNGTLVAKVSPVNNPSADARAGIMIRDTTTAGARFAFLAVSPTGTVYYARRLVRNSSVTIASLGTVTVPTYLMLQRRGTDFSAYKSADGVNWTFLTAVAISMSQTTYAGIAANSSVTASSAFTPTFEDVNAVEGMPNNPPQITFTSGPLAGTTFNTGDTLTFVAAASDRDHKVARVVYTQDGDSVGFDALTPFSWKWPAAAGDDLASTFGCKVVDTSLGANTALQTLSLNILPSGSKVFRSTADAHVREGAYLGANYGALATVTVQGSATGASNHQGYFKFPVEDLGKAKAFLRFYGKVSTATSMTLGVYPVASQMWTETGTGAITKNNAPGRTGSVASFTMTGTTLDWYEVDVTSEVAAKIAAGATSVTFSLISAMPGTAQALINSRQAMVGKPELILRD